MSAGMLSANPGLSYNQIQQVLSTKWKSMNNEDKKVILFYVIYF